MAAHADYAPASARATATATAPADAEGGPVKNTGYNAPAPPPWAKFDLKTGSNTTHDLLGKDKYRSYMVIHVDDIDMCSQREDDAAYVVATIHARFPTTPGDPEHMLGLTRELDTKAGKLHVKQTAFMETMWQTYGKLCGNRVPKSPFPPGLFIDMPPPDECDMAEGKRINELGYQKLVGSLLWAARSTYVECSCGLVYLTTVMSCPTDTAWRAALHMCAYMYHNRHNGIVFTKMEDPSLVIYYDASNKCDRKGRAIGGYIVHMCGGPIEWCARKLPADTQGQSAHHNEYLTLSAASKACTWLRYLFEEMGLDHVFCPKPVPLYGDNDIATALAREERLTVGNRYYRKDSHYSKQAFLNKHTNPLGVAGIYNPSDGMTKAIPEALCARHTPVATGHTKFDKITACISNAPPSRLNRPGGPLHGQRTTANRVRAVTYDQIPTMLNAFNPDHAPDLCGYCVAKDTG